LASEGSSGETTLELLTVLANLDVATVRRGGATEKELKDLTGWDLRTIRSALDRIRKHFPHALSEPLGSGGGEQPARVMLSTEGILGLYPLVGGRNRPSRRPAALGSNPRTDVPKEHVYNYCKARVPASTILVGDHAVLFGTRAVVLPVPLFLTATLAYKTTNTVPGTGFLEQNRAKTALEDPGNVNWQQTFSLHSRSPYSELDESAPQEPDSTQTVVHSDSNLRDCLQALLTRTGDRLAAQGFGLDWVTVRVTSGIPAGCGLGSSGALAAAFGILLQSLPGPSQLIDVDGLQELLRPGKLVRSPQKESASQVFKSACQFEQILQGGFSSGVGPFASLAGSRVSGDAIVYQIVTGDKGPQLYDREEDPQKALPFATVDAVSAERLSDKSKRRAGGAFQWWLQRTACADVFTGSVRTTGDHLRETMNGTRWDDALPGMTEAVDKFIKNFLDRDDNDMRSAMVTYRAHEEAYLKHFSTRKEDDPCQAGRQLVGHFTSNAVAAKYTGSGRGGDIVLFGSPTNVMRSLIPNYFPIHYLRRPEDKDPVLPTLSVHGQS
jgi:hypothetical protein